MASQSPDHPEFAHDEKAFREKIPYQLVPTNLKGVYATPAPPDSFDPNTAKTLDLIKHGIMWRKPTASDAPEVRAVWDQLFSRKWLAKDRIIPEMHPQLGVTHQYRGPAPKEQADASYTGSVWAGAGNKTGKWTTAFGQWTVPTVSAPPEAEGTEGGWNSSSWVGLDGFFYSNDVLQAGVQQKVINIKLPFGGTIPIPIYVAWYEWFTPPQANSPGYIYQTNIVNFPVKPGDVVYCSVQYNATTSGSISFANNTTGQHFSITLAPPPGASFNGQSCEWIMEAPDGGIPTSSLPRFTPVTFTSALACGPNSTLTNPQLGDILNIETASGKLLTSTTVGSQTATISFVG